LNCVRAGFDETHDFSDPGVLEQLQADVMDTWTVLAEGWLVESSSLLDVAQKSATGGGRYV
jgi:hypothetical protein